MCNVDETSQSIRRALTEVNARLAGQGASDKEWTNAVKTKLYQAGHNLGYRVATSLDRKRVTLWTISRNLPCRRIGMGQADIMDDFEKLLVARSCVRLMIFQASKQR